MKKLQDYSALLFIVSLIILTIVSVLGIWKFFEGDVVAKSFETIGLLAVVSGIIMFAGKYMGSNVQEYPVAGEVPQPSLMFPKVRFGTVVALVVSLVVAAFLGVLSIWEVLSSDILNKSWSSIAVIGFCSLIIILVCLIREGHKFFSSNSDSHFSISRVIGYSFLGLILLGIFSSVIKNLIYGF